MPQNEPSPPAGDDPISTHETTGSGRMARLGVPALIFAMAILPAVRLSAAFAGPIGKPDVPADGKSSRAAANVDTDRPCPFESAYRRHIPELIGRGINMPPIGSRHPPSEDPHRGGHRKRTGTTSKAHGHALARNRRRTDALRRFGGNGGIDRSPDVSGSDTGGASSAAPRRRSEIVRLSAGVLGPETRFTPLDFLEGGPTMTITSDVIPAIGKAPIRPRRKPDTTQSPKPTHPIPSRSRRRPSVRGMRPQRIPTITAPKMAPR